MSLLTRKRVLVAKIQTTIGTAISVSGTDGAFNVRDAQLMPTIEYIARKGQQHFGNIPGCLGPYLGTCSFKIDVVGDGAGGVPGWASTFLPACGWVNSAGTFSPKTEAPGSNVKVLTISSFEGAASGQEKQLRDAVGTFVITGEPGKIATFEFMFTGVWVAVTDDTMPTPTYPTRKPIRAANGVLTVGGWAAKVGSFRIDAGNTITPRLDLNQADVSGVYSCIITDRNPTVTIDPESNLVATSNADVYGDWLAREEDALSLVLEDAADTVTIAAPKLQRTNVQPGDRSGIQIDNLTFNCNESSGDDELTIAFAAA